MKIVRQLFSPIAWSVIFLKDVVISVVNQIALNAFVFYHAKMQTEMAKEIENLSQAIRALETKQNATEFLVPLLKGSQYSLVASVDEKKLLSALKTHRTTFWLLRQGFGADQQLCVDSYNYSFNPASPAKKPGSSSSIGAPPPPPIFDTSMSNCFTLKN